jgi:putative DNA primase/helicase
VFEDDTFNALAALAKGKFSAWINLRARIKNEARGVPLAEVDKRIKARLNGGGEDGNGGDGLPGRAVEYAEIEPWEDAVDGAKLLSETAQGIGAYVIMSANQLVAAALWAVFAHTHDLRDYAPLLVITSPMRRCGKTTLQEALAHLVPRPEPMSGMTAAMLPRIIERHHPTLLIDEFDAMMKGDKDMGEVLRGLLNSSFNRASAGVIKLVPTPGGDWQERRFSLWTVACIGGIGKPPDTVEDRAINLRLLRKLVGEKIKRLRGKDGGELDVIARKITRWVADNEQSIRTIEPEEAKGLNDRQQDAWEPLFAIADVAGGEWPERARAAAKALCAVDEAESQERDIKLLLLADIRDIFDKAFPADHAARKAGTVGRPDDGPRLFTKQLLLGLHAAEERPWTTWGKAKKPMTDAQLAAQLHDFSIRSTTVWIDDAQGKGYYLRSFKDAFDRYLPAAVPPTAPQSRKPVTNAGKQGKSENFADVINPVPYGKENLGKAPESGLSYGFTAEKEGKRGGARMRAEIEVDEASSPFINDGGEDQ